ncbi:uncharacterized protein BDV14DRAFT_201415 [Aspergillus stella-maris]|uniref:uncharacterized protein n=1 Tax=Aspergillus stella-maris TaxID=1810926 RepID=UPI003CCD1EE6
MASSRKLTSWFKKPDFAVAAEDSRPEPPTEDPALPQSSPLADLSQILPSDISTDISTPDTPEGPSSQLNRSLTRAAAEPVETQPAPNLSFQSTGTGASFSSSQRTIKNGKEVVISSDGEESDSTGSIEDADELLAKFLTPSKPAPTQSEPSSRDEGYSTLRTGKIPKPRAKPSAPKMYKNSLNSLVTQAKSDTETEAGAARLKASLEAESARKNAPLKSSNLQESVLASAIDDGNDNSVGMQRLLDAVRRTEAFDVPKTWSFFDLQTPLPPAPDFPRECVCPGTYLATLREPDSRERAFHSGIIDFALPRGLLPDELIKWIFHAIPSEPREGLRHAYSRSLKRIPAARIKALIHPEDIDTLFWQLSARPEALTLTGVIEPDAQPESAAPESRPQHHTALLSVLDVFRDPANLFADDTRDRILSIILRLTLDVSLTRNPTLCSAIDRTITSVLDAVTDEAADQLANNICNLAHATLKDAELQSRLLEHIIPVNDWIATLRRRLAYIFLTNDPLVDPSSEDRQSEVYRIIDHLKSQRYNVKRYKRKDQPEYDYGELRALTTFLDIIIDSGWSETKFPNRDAENEFNNAIDLLAERVKKIFSAIEDSGASHLSRTVAKEALDSLHYRIVYTARTKPRPKKSFFEPYEREEKNSKIVNYFESKKDKQVVIRSDKPES